MLRRVWYLSFIGLLAAVWIKLLGRACHWGSECSQYAPLQIEGGIAPGFEALVHHNRQVVSA
jgi:hypothetical protein